MIPIAEEIRIRGTVQGVGFRPTVYRLARACGLNGEVCNDGQGVLIRVSGSAASLAEFVTKLQQECPPLARIQELIRTPYTGELNADGFIISESINNTINTDIVPDTATCLECRQEIFDPFSRFYRYPFTNCTHCGPRLSIIRTLPYDRPHTSMVDFPLCSECAEDYHNLENRRFHAQPIACHLCGPKAWLERVDTQPITASLFSMLDDVDAVCTLLQRGEIVAIKGLGGIHLACDATQEIAVQKLRQRKNRYRKPLALMARDLGVVAEYCAVSPQEEELLTSPASPIVLLQPTGKKQLAPSVAPGQNTLGFMLPYTPLHHLILKRMNRPIVLTSGNVADEPQCITNDEAREKLGPIADYLLLHNREIINRVDDSVVRVIGSQVQTIRRARGYAPAPMSLPPGFEDVPPILAMGGELKNTFCLLRGGEAILSQHLGDLENAAAFDAYQNTLNLYLNIFAHQPEIIAIDHHPEYLSAKLGQQLATANQLQLANIQHHHAHVAACMAEHSIPLNSTPVLGIAFDGLGYGEDGTMWGGEFLLADYCGFQRVATLKPTAMIGGAQAIYQPWRSTYTQLMSAFSWEELQTSYGNLEIVNFLNQKPLQLLHQMREKGINSPLTSSVGRLFDAVARAVGICREESSYEGEAAIALEALVSLNNYEDRSNYPWQLTFLDNIYYMDPSPMWRVLLNDLQRQIPPSIISAKFHQSLAHIVVETVSNLCQVHLINRVVLTGGVFQNRILLEQVKRELQQLELEVFTPSLVPINDGGISLGQAVIAAARSIQRIY